MRARLKVIDIVDMQGDRVRFAHVAKHLYKPSEKWEQVISGLRNPRREACDAGCVPAELQASYPDCCRVTPQCRTHVLQDHEKLLAPAYREALAEAERSGRVGRLGDEKAWFWVGDHGVVVIVRAVGRAQRLEVKTAYRVLPRSGDGTRTEDFFKAAVRRLRDKTSWKGGGS